MATCLACEHNATVTAWWTDDAPKYPKGGDGRYSVPARVWFRLQRLAWKHGCDDQEECTDGKHRRACSEDYPKAKRTLGGDTSASRETPRTCAPRIVETRIHMPGQERRRTGLPPHQQRGRKMIAVAVEVVEISASTTSNRKSNARRPPTPGQDTISSSTSRTAVRSTRGATGMSGPASWKAQGSPPPRPRRQAYRRDAPPGARRSPRRGPRDLGPLRHPRHPRVHARGKLSRPRRRPAHGQGALRDE